MRFTPHPDGFYHKYPLNYQQPIINRNPEGQHEIHFASYPRTEPGSSVVFRDYEDIVRGTAGSMAVCSGNTLFFTREGRRQGEESRVYRLSDGEAEQVGVTDHLSSTTLPADCFLSSRHDEGTTDWTVSLHHAGGNMLSRHHIPNLMAWARPNMFTKLDYWRGGITLQIGNNFNLLTLPASLGGGIVDAEQRYLGVGHSFRFLNGRHVMATSHILGGSIAVCLDIEERRRVWHALLTERAHSLLRIDDTRAAALTRHGLWLLPADQHISFDADWGVSVSSCLSADKCVVSVLTEKGIVEVDV